MMRTQDEILQRIQSRKPDDPWGFEIAAYVEYLDYDAAKEWLKEGTTKAQWDEQKSALDLKERMRDYMPFAWEKANGCRGISAGRSMAHYRAWLWLDGNEALSDKLKEYEHYGKPQLVKVCEYLGLDHTQWDDGERTNYGY